MVSVSNEEREKKKIKERVGDLEGFGVKHL